MHRMTVTLPKKQVKKIDQYRELESRNSFIKKAIWEYIIENIDRIGEKIYGKNKTND